MHGRERCVHMCIACTCVCDVAVMDGVLCCSSGAISQAGSGGRPPGCDAPRSKLKARTAASPLSVCVCLCVSYTRKCNLAGVQSSFLFLFFFR